MTYYLRSLVGSRYSTLVESTQRRVEQCDISKVGYDRVSPEYARRWVKNGNTHETPLWVDWDGKVRYARDAR
jgi:hypothetical protein